MYTLHATEDNLHTLEDIKKRSVVEQTRPMVCRVCYCEYDERGCVCDRRAWVPIDVAILELHMILHSQRESVTLVT